MRSAALLVLIAIAVMSCVMPRKRTGLTPDEQFRQGMLDLLSGRYADAEDLFRHACDSKNGESCKQLALLKSRGHKHVEGMPRLKCADGAGCFEDLNPYVGDYVSDCNKGNRDACRKLGVQLLLTGKEDDAEKIFTKLCSQNDQAGCTGVGLVKADSYKWVSAIESFKKACSAGYLTGCEKWGEAENAHGDKKAAQGIWKKACDKGQLTSCYLLAAWEVADGGEKESGEIHRTNCLKGYVNSCFVMAAFGSNTDLDFAKNAWRASCNDGDYITCGYYAWVMNDIPIERFHRPAVSTEAAATATIVGTAAASVLLGPSVFIMMNGSEEQDELRFRPHQIGL